MGHACALLFNLSLPVAWALRAPLKPLKAAGGLTAWRQLGGKDWRTLPQLRACWREIWLSLGKGSSCWTPTTRSILVVEPNLGCRRYFVLNLFITLALDFGGNDGWWASIWRCQQPWRSCSTRWICWCEQWPSEWWSHSKWSTRAKRVQSWFGLGLGQSSSISCWVNRSTYRSYRRRLDLFSRQCRRRGQGVALEGAYLVLSPLQDVAWDATAGLDYGDMELSDDPFKPLLVILDRPFQHEEVVELPERCQEFFDKFARERGEELQASLVRHQSMLRKLKELQVDIPPLLAGWHLLQRSGVPRWTHVHQVKAMCDGDMSVDRVSSALIRMFGGNSKPNAKDSILKGEIHYMDAEHEDFEDYGHDDVYYQEDDGYAYGFDPDYDDTIDEVEYTGEADEDVPQELDEASLAMEDADTHSRKKMRELALSRGFYPVVAIGMDDNGGASKGRGKASGEKARPKEKAVERALEEKANLLEKDTLCLVPDVTFLDVGVQVILQRLLQRWHLRSPQPVEVRPNMDHDSSAIDFQPTASKRSLMRYRWWRKPMSARWTRSLLTTPLTRASNFVSQAAGWAIMGSGATRTVCGEAGWNRIVEYLNLRNMEAEIDKETKDFRFGDGAMVRSLFRAIIPVCVGKTWRQLSVHVLPGHTPLLLARPDLESWQVVVDYGRRTVMIGDVHVKPAFTANGHYMINIYDDLEDVLSFDELHNIDVTAETFVDSVITAEVPDFKADLSRGVWEGSGRVCLRCKHEEPTTRAQAQVLGSLCGWREPEQVPSTSIPWCGGQAVFSANLELWDEGAASRFSTSCWTRRTPSHHGDSGMSSLVTNAKHELQNTRETGVAQGLVKLGRGDPLGLLQEHPRRRQAPHLRHNFREPCRCSFIRNRNSGLHEGLLWNCPGSLPHKAEGKPWGRTLREKAHKVSIKLENHLRGGELALRMP